MKYYDIWGEFINPVQFAICGIALLFFLMIFCLLTAKNAAFVTTVLFLAYIEIAREKVYYNILFKNKSKNEN